MATLKKGHTYYYFIDGKKDCNQHKSYLREEKLIEQLRERFKEI